MVCHVCQLSVAKFAGVRPVMIKEMEDRNESQSQQSAITECQRNRGSERLGRAILGGFTSVTCRPRAICSFACQIIQSGK